MAAKKTMGICIVGAGMMGRNHARAWAGVPGAHLVAVADVDEARGNALKEDFGFETSYRDYREAVDSPDVDIVSICVPAYYHPEVAVFAADCGKHVLSEKPIALTVAKAEEMIAAAKRNNVCLGVGFQLRYLQSTEKIKRLLAEEAIGRPVMWVYSFSMPIRPKVAMHDMLTGNGGPVVDFCPHRFDLWRQCFASEPVQVMAQGMTFAQGRPELAALKELAPDTMALIVTYASGDVGVVSITWGLPPGVNGKSYAEMWGNKGLIEPDMDKVRLLTEGGVETTFGPYGEDVMTDAMRKQAQEFLQAAVSGTEPVVTGEDGLSALQVSLAAIRSAKSGKPVDPKEIR